MMAMMMMVYHQLLLLCLLAVYCSSSSSFSYIVTPTPPSSPTTHTNTHSQTHNISFQSSHKQTKALNITTITWNLAEKCPSAADSKFLHNYRDSDVVVIGAQEVEDVKFRRQEGHRSAAWKALQLESLGNRFECITQHRIGGIHIGVYIKKRLIRRVKGVQIIDVACGVGNVLTNKGGIGVLIRVKGRTLCFITAHLAAHQDKVKERNADYHRIMSSIILRSPKKWLLKNKNASSAASTIGTAVSYSDDKNQWLEQVFASAGLPPDKRTAPPVPVTAIKTAQRTYTSGKKRADNRLTSTNKLKKKSEKTSKSMDKNSHAVEVVHQPPMQQQQRQYVSTDNYIPFDGIIIMGDFNYRVDLPRLEVELLKEELLTLSNSSRQRQLYSIFEYDQLTAQRIQGNVFNGFKEGTITFLPTFKYDKGTDTFDSSSKARNPAWTDRILYAIAPPSVTSSNSVSATTTTSATGKLFDIQLSRYYSVDSRHSDHRPVVAQFLVPL